MKIASPAIFGFNKLGSTCFGGFWWNLMVFGALLIAFLSHRPPSRAGKAWHRVQVASTPCLGGCPPLTPLGGGAQFSDACGRKRKSRRGKIKNTKMHQAVFKSWP